MPKNDKPTPPEENETPYRTAADGTPLVPKFPIATVVEISIIGVFPASEYPALQTAIDKFQEELREKFIALGGRDPHPRWAEARQASKEEVLHFTPRKMHMERGGRQICDTAYVARRNLTRNREKVTCKLCMRKMGISDWKE